MPKVFPVILLFLNLMLSAPALAADQVSLSGSLQALACPQVCGSCCGTHSITDTTGNIKLEVGNAFVELAKRRTLEKFTVFLDIFIAPQGSVD